MQPTSGSQPSAAYFFAMACAISEVAPSIKIYFHEVIPIRCDSKDENLVAAFIQQSDGLPKFIGVWIGFFKHSRIPYANL